MVHYGPVNIMNSLCCPSFAVSLVRGKGREKNSATQVSRSVIWGGESGAEPGNMPLIPFLAAVLISTSATPSPKPLVVSKMKHPKSKYKHPQLENKRTHAKRRSLSRIRSTPNWIYVGCNGLLNKVWLGGLVCNLLGEGVAVHRLPFCFVVLSTPGLPLVFSSFSYLISVSRAHDGHMTFVQVLHWSWPLLYVNPSRSHAMLSTGSITWLRPESCTWSWIGLRRSRVQISSQARSASGRLFNVSCAKASWIDHLKVLRFSFPVPVVDPSAKDFDPLQRSKNSARLVTHRFCSSKALPYEPCRIMHQLVNK